MLYRGDGPDDLPITARPAKAPTPFEPPERPGWWREYWRPNERWNDAKITATLRQVLQGRDEWPPPGEFIWSGRTALLDAVRRRGGSVAWARRTGVRQCRRSH